MGARVITSTSNPQVRQWARLKLRRERTTSGRFLIEGARELERALAAGVDVEHVLYATDAAASLLAQLPEEVPRTALGPSAFAAVSIRRHPPAIAGVGLDRGHDLDSVRPPPHALVLIADGIEKPGNLGAMVRTAEAVGADAVIVANPATDLTNPNVIRASQGAVFALPVGAGSGADVIEWAATHAVRLVVASPSGSVDLWKADLTGSIGVVVGSESAGVSDGLAAGAEHVRIPMAGTGDSLNASVAAALVLYESRRQRT